MAAPLCLQATLAHPPGVNHLWRHAAGGRGPVRVYKSAQARAWEQTAVLQLRAAGFRILPAGDYWLGVELHLRTIALDVDAPAKIALDTIQAALGVSDSRVGHLLMTKTRVRHRVDQCLEARVRIVALDDLADFNGYTQRITAHVGVCGELAEFAV